MRRRFLRKERSNFRPDSEGTVWTYKSYRLAHVLQGWKLCKQPCFNLINCIVVLRTSSVVSTVHWLRVGLGRVGFFHLHLHLPYWSSFSSGVSALSAIDVHSLEAYHFMNIVLKVLKSVKFVVNLWTTSSSHCNCAHYCIAPSELTSHKVLVASLWKWGMIATCWNRFIWQQGLETFAYVSMTIFLQVWRLGRYGADHLQLWNSFCRQPQRDDRLGVV